MPLQDFHPAVARWFERAFRQPTPAQAAAWPPIRAGRHTLVAAPTGSGKTLTAFLAALDALVHQGLSPAGLPAETAVVYVSPLKALSNDIRLNLEAPLAGIRAELAALGLPDVEIRTAVRTGDTPQRERQQSLRKPPHILVTTPESLYVLLGSGSGRKMLSTVRTVIVDEIHAIADSKRGSHLALSLERLQALCAAPLTRIGLSATQKPIEAVAHFLVGASGAEAAAPANCSIIDIGYAKQRDLALELPPTPLAAVMSNEQWEQVYARIVELAATHSTTLVFVNTRRMAERAARHLGELLGKGAVAAHHGSLAKETRLDAEQRLKRGELKLLVATASLELGLDIGDVELVCQLGSPRSIASFLQRAGRAGHAVGGVPKARLFPQSRDELVECAALLDCVRRGELDALHVLPAPLDVLAQQIVAETACCEWDEDALFALVRRAGPYAALKRSTYDDVVAMVCEGYTTRQGPRAGYVHRDAVHHRLRERKGARLTALTSGGTIPETGDYNVVLEPQAHTVGSVNEDFAVESLAGDVFQLGNTSYKILKIEPGRVRVEDAQGAAPNIPFWLGEAPGRTDELSFGVSRLREEVGEKLAAVGLAGTIDWLADALMLSEDAARQMADYLARGQAALAAMPTQQHLVIERFFDASDGMQLVIHSPFGSRLNRAWGLALRKRFCRQFNFELQAAATEDAIVLSLSTSHSFPLLEVSRYLHSATALHVLTQALLDAPLFGVRWRWNATTALALPRFSGGRKVAPQLQRMRSEDLLAAVFPDQVACAENLVGEREVPEHPLVAQTLYDCLYDAMDAEGWLQLLRRMEAGEVLVSARDLPAPSPLAAEALNARPYAFLDDAPLEERRTQAVANRRFTDPDSADDLGQLDADAIAAVREEAWPEARSADEMHEALNGLGLITDGEAARDPRWVAWLGELAKAGRATRLLPMGAAEDVPGAVDGSAGLWVAAERLCEMQVLYPGGRMQPAITAPARFAAAPESAEAALRELLRSRLAGLGPVTSAALAGPLQLPAGAVTAALFALQTEGYVLQGRFTPQAAPDAFADVPELPLASASGSEPGLAIESAAAFSLGVAAAPEWCERHLLARIHRYTLKRLRREIEPVEPRDFVRFLFEWQHVGTAQRVTGPDALPGILAQLEGYEAPAALWEAEILPARVNEYSPTWLDDLCTAGRTLWTRLRPVAATSAASAGSNGASSSGSNVSLRTTPIVLLPRRNASLWTGLAPAPADDSGLSSRARRAAAHLGARGASFFDEIVDGSRLLRTEVEEALTELVVSGRANNDSYAGLRALLVPPSKRASEAQRRRRRMPLFGIEDAGRWSLVRPPLRSSDDGGAGGGSEAGDGDDGEDIEGREGNGAPAASTAARSSASERAAALSEALESATQVARTLLRRYGVLCWQMVGREAAWLPPWRELVRACRRLEARGEIRGGRFIAGVSGEQFALPEAITLMRQVRRQPPDLHWICLAAADPANLLGSIVPGPRVARVSGSRVLYRDGMPVATSVAGQIEWLAQLTPAEQQQAARTLTLDFALRTPVPAMQDGT